jgi:hypothetical protein
VKGKEGSSFSEEKEAKRLFHFALVSQEQRAQRGKVFWFFFSKKNSLLTFD